MIREEAKELLKAYKSWWDDKPCKELNEIDNEFLDAYFNNSAQSEALSVGNNEQAKEFFKELEIKQVNISPDIAKVLDKHLWDLL